MRDLIKDDTNSVRAIWLQCDLDSLAIVGLRRALEGRVEVYRGDNTPDGTTDLVILCSDDMAAVQERLDLLHELSSEIPVLVFGSRIDLPLARSALRAGARGYIHAGMGSQQVLRAVEVAAQGQMVAPRELVEYLIANEEKAELSALSTRQKDILEYVVEGLSNAEIADRLYLSESTIKQHLRAAYKLLGVKNRMEAAKILRSG